LLRLDLALRIDCYEWNLLLLFSFTTNHKEILDVVMTDQIPQIGYFFWSVTVL
jgi:hypothetical protein